MSQTPGEKSGLSATARSEELLDSMGRRIGLFAALAGQRIQNAAASVREGVDRVGQQNTTAEEKASQPTIASAEEKGKLAMERSEELVDRMARRLSHYASLVGFQVQKAAALAREEAEDIWAEAQNIRQENSRKPQ
ncbi:MAG: hypothetical protein JOZ18_09995 [Chloroflexi bacterium]|nr:hypothetical protein [Chloroflexota bacterium]